MNTIIVTGGAGFIGGCFVRITVGGSSTRLINLDKLTYAGNLDSLHSVWDKPNHIFVEGDIGNQETVDELLRAYKPDAVINFAAESHVDRSIDSPAKFIQTNVLGTCRLLESVRDYWQELDQEQQSAFRFLHVSTDEVYGSLGKTGYFTESTSFSPNSPYAASKASSDHFVRAFHKTYGLPTLTTNCSNNYGPYQFPEKLIPLMILNAAEGKPLPIYGDGLHMRDWLYVDDHCRAIQLVLEKGRVGETYNIGGNAERTNREIVDTICRHVDKLRPDLAQRPSSSLIRFVEDRPGHDRRYAIDATKIREELGWEPAQTIETGIEQTVAWYINNMQWVDRVTSGNYKLERR
ncbi:MAG: dTDP-glucose 4,6-dehydratase [Planctomycetaceae bacterium]|nr:dTDP-glucose 4,6-dehydratase [Planctomycetaceae bacterium]